MPVGAPSAQLGSAGPGSELLGDPPELELLSHVGGEQALSIHSFAPMLGLRVSSRVRTCSPERSSQSLWVVRFLRLSIHSSILSTHLPAGPGSMTTHMQFPLSAFHLPCLCSPRVYSVYNWKINAVTGLEKNNGCLSQPK